VHLVISGKDIVDRILTYFIPQAIIEITENVGLFTLENVIGLCQMVMFQHRSIVVERGKSRAHIDLIEIIFSSMIHIMNQSSKHHGESLGDVQDLLNLTCLTKSIASVHYCCSVKEVVESVFSFVVFVSHDGDEVTELLKRDMNVFE
jgi:hypothetical protein